MFFFFNDTATTEIYTLSLHDALPISGFRTSTPAPSERTYPLALASKLLQRPSGASMDALLNPMVPSGRRIRLTPPVSATSHSPFQMLWQAMWVATSDEEQAVSIAKLGPCRSKR